MRSFFCFLCFLFFGFFHPLAVVFVVFVLSLGVAKSKSQTPTSGNSAELTGSMSLALMSNATFYVILLAPAPTETSSSIEAALASS
jgi:hypothetical protein